MSRWVGLAGWRGAGWLAGWLAGRDSIDRTCTLICVCCARLASDSKRADVAIRAGQRPWGGICRGNGGAEAPQYRVVSYGRPGPNAGWKLPATFGEWRHSNAKDTALAGRRGDYRHAVLHPYADLLSVALRSSLWPL